MFLTCLNYSYKVKEQNTAILECKIIQDTFIYINLKYFKTYLE